MHHFPDISLQNRLLFGKHSSIAREFGSKRRMPLQIASWLFTATSIFLSHFSKREKKLTLLINWQDYNCTVEFVRSHFLVREGIRVNGQGNSNPTLSIDRIDKSAPRWKRADILIFNTAHWWTHGKTARG